MQITEVVAALIWNNNRFMANRRPLHKTRGGLWEFVGGKVEKGESKEQALIRECKEEMDVEIEVGDLFCELVHEYPDITVRLSLFNSKIVKGEPKLLEHMEIKWLLPSEVDDYEFCPADKEILEKLKKL